MLSSARQRLREAARSGDIGGVRAALADGADNLDEALREAIREDQALAAGYLIDRGADFRANEDKVMRLAARDGSVECLRLLLDRGADIHALDECALYWAAANDRPEAVRVLLKRGADPEALGRYPCPSGRVVTRLLRNARWKRRAARWKSQWLEREATAASWRAKLFASRRQ